MIHLRAQHAQRPSWFLFLVDPIIVFDKFRIVPNVRGFLRSQMKHTLPIMSLFICLTLFLSLSSTQNSLSCSSFSSQQVCESSVDVDCESTCVWNVGQTTSTTSSTSSTASSTIPQSTPHSSRVISPSCASLSAPWDCVRGHCAQTGSACTFHHDRCVCSTQRGYDDVAESDTDICAAIKERWLVRFRFFLVFVKNFEHKSCVVHGCQL